MSSLKHRLPAAMLVVLVGVLAGACSDVGDNSGLPPGTSGDGGSDGTTLVEGGAGDDGSTAMDAATDSGGADGTMSSPGEGGPSESSVEDSTTPEPEGGGGPETSTVDAGMDTGLPEAAAETSTPEPAIEAGPEPASEPGPEAATEAGPDATVDAGHDSGGGGPTPCTTAPCAASGTNSVQCPNSPTSDGVCTATEAAIVAKDIAAGNLSGGQLAAFTDTITLADQGSCYNCLNSKSCLDDNSGDTGNECGDSPDLTGQGGGTAGTAGQGPALCVAVLDCILGANCQGAGGITGTSATTAQENVNLCYCGGNNAGSVCGTAGAGVNGACVTQEAAGSGFAASDNKDMLANFGSKVYPYGIANHIFQCAASQKCTICK